MLRDSHFISCTLNMTRFHSMTQFFHHLQNIYKGLKRILGIGQYCITCTYTKPKRNSDYNRSKTNQHFFQIAAFLLFTPNLFCYRSFTPFPHFQDSKYPSKLQTFYTLLCIYFLIVKAHIHSNNPCLPCIFTTSLQMQQQQQKLPSFSDSKHTLHFKT
jgi:hypothetical protein